MSGSPYGSRLLGPADQSPRALRSRVQALLTVSLVLTNMIGAGIVVGILLLVRPESGIDRSFLIASFIAVPVYVVGAVALGATVGTRQALAALRWAYTDQEPTDADRVRTLRVPLRLTGTQAQLWAVATLLFGALALILDADLFTAELLGVGIAGVVVCSIAYLLSEFALRPVAARALEEGVPHGMAGNGVRRRMLVFWSLGTGVPVAGLITVAILALAGDELTLSRLAVVDLVLGGVVLVFGFAITGLTARAVVQPIMSVRAGLERVQAGDFDQRIPVYDGTELGLLQSGFNQMSGGLAERSRIRDLFGRHVGEDVASAALESDVELGGEVRQVSVLFVDVTGSTTLATKRPATEVVDLLNRFCAIVIDEVDREKGLVNKFMGDAVLAIFGAPVARDGHATEALRAARAAVRRLIEELPDIDIGAGVATGEAVAGNIGDERRFEYTVIGDVVNTASRLSTLAKARPGRVVAARVSLDECDDDERAHWVDDGEETLRGRDQPTAIAVVRDAGRGSPGSPGAD